MNTNEQDLGIVIVDPALLPPPPLTLDDLKADKNAEINAARLKANRSSFPFQGKQIACDELSRSDIDAVAGFISLYGGFPPGFPKAWKATDNTFVPLPDIAAFKAMYAAMAAQGNANFAHAQELKQALAEAETAEEVAAITW